MLTQASKQAPQSEKQRRTGKDTTSHGLTLETVLVDIDLVILKNTKFKPAFSRRKDTINNNKNNSLEENHNGRFRKKEANNHVFSTQDTSTPPLLDPEDSNAQQNKKRHRSSDSLSSIDSNSSHLLRMLPYLLRQLTCLITSDPLTVHPIKPLPPSSSSSHPTTLPPPAAALKLYVCDGCLRYLFSPEAYLEHKIRCRVSHPPGRKVYQSGEIIIREIDGSKEKLYCQCLCLFGKLFIDHQYIFFNVEGFKFYVLTIVGDDQPPKPTEEEELNGKREKIVGFFSKEKISYDGYNLACIVTLPPYQKRGYGSLLIEFSYELDRYEAKKIKANDQDQIPTKVLLGTPERPLSVMGARGYLHFWTAVLVRFFRTLFTPPAPRLDRSGNQQTQVIEITLDEISRSTRIRPDDVAFSLISSGLTCLTLHAPDQTTPSSTSSQNNPSLDDDSCIQSFLITSELVETVARKMKVKKAILDPRHILLNSPQNVDHDDPNEVDRSDEINDWFIHSDHSCILHLPSSPDPGLDSSAPSNPPRISYFGNHHNHNHTSSQKNSVLLSPSSTDHS
ncbi:hypothetical protein H4Q26_013024 [Puccinia striiformis f. sp. tritici PST-130]|nr:hypothetical protein H4Q26_013024 [Puccinia striiformis f. sp. tritici PST-130]